MTRSVLSWLTGHTHNFECKYAILYTIL